MLHAASIVVTHTHARKEKRGREAEEERARERTAAGRKYWDVISPILGFHTLYTQRRPKAIMG